ncbi:MAG: AAA family ATPase [Caulobacteraceae bacterium]|nr:AAA family ATPase [Caulobacteraceae bacterium]
MKRHILTGAPGAGKTAILRRLEVLGHCVVEEAATDVIALRQAEGEGEPWTGARFIEDIVDLQRRRRTRASALPVSDQIHDRSAVCTHALCRFLDRPIPPALSRELEDIAAHGVFQRQVFFVRAQDFITPTAARRISLEDALRFEAVHVESYQTFGYDLVWIEPAALSIRADQIERRINTPCP